MKGTELDRPPDAAGELFDDGGRNMVHVQIATTPGQSE
jgi:hypothetical protein